VLTLSRLQEERCRPQYFSRPPPYYLLPETRYDAILAGLCPSDPYKSNLSRRLSFRHRGGSDQRRGVRRGPFGERNGVESDYPYMDSRLTNCTLKNLAMRVVAHSRCDLKQT
jgi:hypothetical protein